MTGQQTHCGWFQQNPWDDADDPYGWSHELVKVFECCVWCLRSYPVESGPWVG